MHRVAQAEVLREWLRVERSHPDADWFPVAPLSEEEALDELLDRKPGAAAFVWRDAPVRWYETTVDGTDLTDLRLVEGPPNLRWRDLAPDGTVWGAAERIARGDPDELTAETGVDVQLVLDFVEEMPEGPLVLSTREGCVPRYVADGNHRAVALALRARSGARWESRQADPEQTEPQQPDPEPAGSQRTGSQRVEPRPAYLGVGANPVARPLLERLCGMVRELIAPKNNK